MITAFLLCSRGFLTAQKSYDETIVTYNLLYYKGDNRDDDAREDDIRKVIHSIKPDILVVQEVYGTIGYSRLLQDILNFEEPGRYVGAPFSDQPATDADIALFYNPDNFDFVSTSVIDITSAPGRRDAVEFVVSHRETATDVRLYGVHLKAGNPDIDPENGQEREAECSALRTYLNALLPDSHFLVLGDFNFYTSLEKGFQQLTESQVDNDGRLFDPIDRTGDWHDHNAYAAVHTQSSRGYYKGSEYGGLDDRFDFILSSSAILEASNVNYVAGSYTAFGNDGNHLNQAINEGNNAVVSSELADALVEASDHLPVHMKLRFISGETSPHGVAINEIMQNPQAVGDAYGEWFEIYSADTAALDLRGWIVKDNGDDHHVITGDTALVIEPGQYFVLGRNSDTTANGGVHLDYEYSGIDLVNNGDEILLLDSDSLEVDRVEYNGDFPAPNGASMALVDVTLDNNVGANWTLSTAPYGDGDFGTPGSHNFPYLGPVWHVSANGSNIEGNGSQKTPFATIQHGIDKSENGDTVLVYPGRYRERVNFNGKSIALMHWGTVYPLAGIPDPTVIIDGDSSGTVVVFENGEGADAVLSGFSIVNGKSERGGGIYCKNSSPTISDCIIENNSADWYGGGIYLEDSNPTITNCIISNNEISIGVEPALLGAGIHCHNSNPIITKCIIRGNMGSISGGISCDRSSPTLISCTVTRNHGYHSGGLSCVNGSFPRVINSILWDNRDAEVYFANYGDSNSVIIAYSDLSGGEAGIVTSGNGSIEWLQGNVEEDPLFVNPESGDFELTEASPCVDAGVDLFVFEGDTLVHMSPDQYINSAPDMGALEFGRVTVPLESHIIPQKFVLYQNYPNPFNLMTTLSYELSDRFYITLAIYNLLGRRVRILVSRVEQPGLHSVIWDGMDDYGNPASSGVYLYRISTVPHPPTQETAGLQTRNMILLR